MVISGKRELVQLYFRFQIPYYSLLKKEEATIITEIVRVTPLHIESLVNCTWLINLSKSL
jgi:hypothetical protein